MRPIRTITNARLRHADGLHDVLIDGGMIQEIRPCVGAPLASQGDARANAPDAGDTFDACGNLVTPAFVDSHLHLDLAYSLDMVPPNESGTLVEAIRHWADAKRTITADDVTRRAIRAIKAEVAFGTGFIRTHVDVATSAGLRLAEGVLAAREATKHLCTIEIVVFPQDGIIKDPGAFEQMRKAMRMGCDTIGGIAHNERTAADSRRHCEMLFELSSEFNAPIDCHIDETDAPESRCVEELASITLANPSFAGRVTASHVCALASYSDVHAAKVISLIAAARVHVVCNPQVNMHLQGRFDRYPKRRGMTRVSELRAAGVTVAAGQDCINDPFYPLGTGQMLDVAHMLVHADHLSRPQDLEYAFDCITTNAAEVLRLGHSADGAESGTAPYGTEPGCGANLVILPVDRVSEAIRLRPRPLGVIHNGRLVDPSDLD